MSKLTQNVMLPVFSDFRTTQININIISMGKLIYQHNVSIFDGGVMRLNISHIAQFNAVFCNVI